MQTTIVATLMVVEDVSIDEVLREINEFVSERDWDQFHNPKNLASSISIESSELQELLQWTSPSFNEISTDPERKKMMEDELADVMIYSLRFCTLLGSNPLEIIRRKVKENGEKYPVSLSKGSSKKYTEL